ncbi:hypothetical protein BJ138DRAFT_1120042 [Hygrophoropsis aurantiaca]|uniref:Uncharacterized protein n=1 Tax=Hygrophoropsis aurantiaca TaxID=72124 RepID=A0ACB7ZSY2_9AGAM|nr:hypothetical protein BJ138DRAFT_1120042 [Hygrophoropsis aurantiaca]
MAAPYSIKYFLLLRRTSPHLRQLSVHAPRGVQLTAEQSHVIIDTLNEPYDDSTDFGWSQFNDLPRMLTPSSRVYYVNVSNTNINTAMTAPFLLMWEKIQSYSPFRNTATHAAHFYVQTDRPYSSVSLASFLTSFCTVYSPARTPEDENRGGGHVVRLGYYIDRFGVAGVILCNERTLDPEKDLTLHGMSAIQPFNSHGRQFNFISRPASESHHIRSAFIRRRCLILSR